MRVIFSTSDVHARDRVDYWREEAGRALVPHQFQTPHGRAFEGVIQAGSLGFLNLSVFSCGECSAQRTQSCVERAFDDDLLLSVQLEGGMTAHQDGRDASLTASDMLLLDPRRPFSCNIRPATRSLVVKIPRSEIQARLGEITMLTGRTISGAKPVGALTSGFLSMLIERTTELNECVGDKLAQQALDLIALTFEKEILDGRANLSSARTTTLLRLKAIIESRLYDPDLKPTAAAAAAGISVRYANALLAQEGMSLERFIMFRRLQHCYQALTDPAQILRTVSDIAYSCGFSDVSHFARRFKAEFTCSPSECRPYETPKRNKCAMPSSLRKRGKEVTGAGH
jgi:AraC family transcriptional regulator, positive regulator of tynA and feaB